MNLQKMQQGSKIVKMMHMCTSFGPTIVDAVLPQWHNIMVL